MMSRDVLDCTNVPSGNHGDACGGMAAYGCWDMRLVPILLSIFTVAFTKVIVYVLWSRLPSLDDPHGRGIMLIVLWECQSLWWAAGAAAGRFPARAVFPCRFWTPWSRVELSSPSKASFFFVSRLLTFRCHHKRRTMHAFLGFLVHTLCHASCWHRHANGTHDSTISCRCRCSWTSRFPMNGKSGTMGNRMHKHAGHVESNTQ